MSESNITIRGIEAFEELEAVPAVEKEVWGLSETDVMPLTLIIATKEAGSLWLGAFDGPTLIGFAFGFHGVEGGRLMIHSHMLAVLPAYREANIGYRLKLQQRERALAMGIQVMTWTFDPLQSKNAHLNFAKLGVISNRYKPDFYGPETSSVLHRNSTDRLWVQWHMSSRRVQARLGAKRQAPRSIPMPDTIPALVRMGDAGQPNLAKSTLAPDAGRVTIEIPPDINLLQERDQELAAQWREATRWAFTEALKQGFVVSDFIRPITHSGPAGQYVLTKASIDEICV